MSQPQFHCRLIQANEVTIDRTWAYSLYDPFWRFYRNRDDGAVILGDDGEHPMRAGVCMLVPAWGRFTTRCTKSVRHSFLHFDPIGLPGAWVREHCTRIVPLVRRPEWDALLDALPDRDPQAWSLHLRFQAMMCEAITIAIAHAGGESAHVSDGSRHANYAVVQPAVRWIDQHLRDPLPIELLAGRCGVSRDPFSRIFTVTMGSAPARYVAERRITAAAMRLLNTDDAIEDIAEAVGFTNRYHFSRVFQRVLRISPAAYRRQVRPG